MKLKHLLASLAFAAVNLAHAAPITVLTYGQSGASTSTITATTTLTSGVTSTNIRTTSNPAGTEILITGIAPNVPGYSAPPAVVAYLTLDATSVAAPTTTLLGTTFNQLYSGHFEINSLADGTGVHILDAVFTNALVSGLFGGNALTFAASTLDPTISPIPLIIPTLTFGPTAFPGIHDPFAASFAFSAVNPIVQLATNTNGAQTGVQTLAAFTASFAGTDSANIPEPSTNLLFGLGLFVAAALSRRRSKLAA